MSNFISYSAAERAWARGCTVWIYERGELFCGIERETRRSWRKARELRAAARRFAYHVSIEGDSAKLQFKASPSTFR